MNGIRMECLRKSTLNFQLIIKVKTFIVFLILICGISSLTIFSYAQTIAETNSKSISFLNNQTENKLPSIWNKSLQSGSLLAGFLQTDKISLFTSVKRGDDPNQVQHWLAGSYYSIEDGLTATLMLNNKGITPIVVQPTLYSKDGQELHLPVAIVEATSFRYINLNDWIQLGGESFRQGNIRLYHTGKDLVLGAQIYLQNDSNSFSYEEKLAELGKFNSRRLEGLWTIPSKRSDVKIILTNTGSETLNINGRLTREPSHNSPVQTFTLSPHETKILDMKRDFPTGGAALNTKAVSLSLEHSGPNWALLARALISETSTGYSNLAQFYNPTTGLMQEYHGAGIQMRSPDGELLKPVIALKNTSAETSVVTTKIPYTRTDGTSGSVSLPTVQLLPNEVKLVNTSAIEARNNQEDIKFASIEIKYNTPAGSIGVAVHSESQNRDFVSRVPLWDPLRQYTATGGYPWLIEGTSVTKNYIKNITDRPQKYVAFFIWENNGMYMIGQKELGPYESVEIDPKNLRDNQVPDENGNTIPQYISSGQFQWTLISEENVDPEEDPLSELAIIGRSEQIDWGKKISNNYACQNCCMGNTVGGHLSPNSATVEVDSSIVIRAYIEQETCFGFPYSYESNQTSATWTTDDPVIATVSGGTVTGNDIGTVNISASFHGPRRLSNPPCPPGEGPYLFGCAEGIDNTKIQNFKGGNKNQENSDQLAPGCGECFGAGTYYANKTATITSVGTPQVNEVNPAGLVPGQQDVYVRITGRKFGYNPTINISGGGVTAVYDIRTPDGFDARFTIDENAQVGQRQLTVTAGGRTSNAVPFTVGDRSPVITSISRSQASNGETFSVSIEGQNFGLNPLITFSQPGISYAINAATTTTTHIDATFTVAPNATPGNREIKVVSRGINGTGFEQVPQQSNTSNGVPFQVNSVMPQVSDIGVVEKNGLKDVTLSFAAGGAPTSGTTVKLKLERTSGLGSATFENGTSEVTYTGTNGQSQTFRIKGITESNQVNNFKVQAEVGGNASGQPKNFTVAVISSLEFERINTSGTNPDVPLDANPGIDGVHTPEEGLRIYPDKNTSGTEPDRSVLRVNAMVSPANIPNLKVYFASFDLDDPSALSSPIDSTGNNGDDNNGSVNMSKSGELQNPGGTNCMGQSITGNISFIECSVSNNIASANYKVTMQPGDNFAVAASLSNSYRNNVNLDSNAGANLINNAGQIIPISGNPNPNNVQGIRTEMLTVWRRLHIETDSMGEIRENYSAGSTTSFSYILRGRNGTLNLSVSNLEIDRFENGRVVIGSSAGTLSVTSNTDNSVTITNGTSNNITFANNTNFSITNSGSNRTVAGTIPTGGTILASQSLTIFVNSTALGTNSFQNGTFTIISNPISLKVTGNTANSIDVTNTTTGSVSIVSGSVFTLYDDDDYDDLDGMTLDGDDGEDLAEKTQTFSTMRNSDLPAQNAYAAAYIRPEYNWAQSQGYNQNNITYKLNRTETSTQIIAFLNSHRNSDTSESNEFWVGYVFLGYQSSLTDDNDPGTETSLGGITDNLGISDSPPVGQGGNNSLIYLENCVDIDLANGSAEFDIATAAHEVGHQMGLAGDSSGFGIMSSGETLIFVDAHIDLLRKRIKSPGK